MPQENAGAMESLYPFLYSGRTDLSAVMEQVRASTVAKAQEIIELRQTVGVRDARMADGARQAAARFAAGGRLFAFGNGGSATDAAQLATLFLNPGGDARPLPAFGLANDTSVITALGNDVGVEVVFARQLAAFGGRDDIAVGLSTSGNSGNLVRAFDEASRRGMLTIGLAGTTAGRWPSWTASTTCSWCRRRPCTDPGGADHDLPGAVGADRRGSGRGGGGGPLDIAEKRGSVCSAYPVRSSSFTRSNRTGQVDVTGYGG